MKRRAGVWIAAAFLLAACGSGATRYVSPKADAPATREADYADCVAQGEMIRDLRERQILIDNCMGERGYRLKPEA